jgi:membrane protease subunit HflK
MPWNDNAGGGGPWGSGGGGNDNPWRRGPGSGRPGGPGGEPPDLDELIRRLQARLNKLFGGGRGGKGKGSGVGVAALIGGAAVVWLAWPGSAWYVVGPQEAGVVLRFGEYSRTTGSGLRFKLPYPFETVMLPNVTETRNTQVGATERESRMITQGEDIIDTDFVVQWRVAYDEPDGVRNFLFNIRDPEGTVKAVAESAMREVVGTSQLQPLITEGRTEAARRAREIVQTTLADYNSGIRVLDVQLEESSAPESVIDAFRDVDAAAQDAATAEQQARAYANQVVPEARGEAARILEQARGYRDRVIAEAQGQAERFDAIYAEYAEAPEVTRQRIFFETMERVLGRSELIILDQSGGNGAVPYLPLDQLGRNRQAQPNQTQGSGG